MGVEEMSTRFWWGNVRERAGLEKPGGSGSRY